MNIKKEIKSEQIENLNAVDIGHNMAVYKIQRNRLLNGKIIENSEYQGISDLKDINDWDGMQPLNDNGYRFYPADLDLYDRKYSTVKNKIDESTIWEFLDNKNIIQQIPYYNCIDERSATIN